MLDTNAPFVLDWRNGLGLALSVLVAFISGPGGQGGGSFYVVIFSVLLGFSTNQASALTAGVVFLGCISMGIQAVATSHPQLRSVPVIDYSLVLAMTPSLIIGLALGVLVNAVVSQWLLNLLIIAIWTWSSIRLCFSYRAARLQEKHHQQQQQQHGEQQEPQQQMEQQKQEAPDDVLHSAPATGPITFQLVVCCDADPACSNNQPQDLVPNMATRFLFLNRVWSCCTATVAALKGWASYQPWGVIAAAGALFVFFIACQVIQGMFTPMCSHSYWAITGVLCGVGVAAAVVVSWWLLRTEAEHAPQQASERSGTADKLPQTSTAGAVVAAAKPASSGGAEAGAVLHGRQPGNGSVVRWTHSMLMGIHIQMLVAGLMLGAWPLSPIILAIPGMHPQVGAGTSKLMLFLITAGAGLSFIAAGNINISYLLVYGLVNAVATPLGVWLVDWAIKRTGRPSCIIMLTVVRLLVCVVLQAALQAVPSLIALAHGLPRAGFMAQPFCHSKA